ncbi:MAG: hypothetical protein LUD27_06150 [Clostridia bacterium]|nr:hypothetical protein [Clostridia bacterium]
MKIRLSRARLRLAAVQATRVVQVKAQKIANKCEFYSHDDPDGSYTGVSRDGEMPVQDVDDL